jgi:hypothetical protein
MSTVRGDPVSSRRHRSAIRVVMRTAWSPTARRACCATIIVGYTSTRDGVPSSVSMTNIEVADAAVGVLERRTRVTPDVLGALGLQCAIHQSPEHDVADQEQLHGTGAGADGTALAGEPAWRRRAWSCAST